MPLSHLIPAVFNCLSQHRLAVINQSINHMATEMWQRVDWSTGTGHPWRNRKATRPSVLKTCIDYLKMNSECTVLMQISQTFEKRIISLYVHIVKRIFFFRIKFSVKNVYWLPHSSLRLHHFDKNFSNFSRGDPHPHPREGMNPSPTRPLSALRASMKPSTSLVTCAPPTPWRLRFWIRPCFTSTIVAVSYII